MSNKVGRDDAGEGSTPKKRLKTRSEVWEHFTKINNGTGANCLYCNKEFSLKWGTTTHLKRHLKSCDKFPQGDIAQPSKITENNERAAIDQPPPTACEDVVRNFGATQRPPTRASEGDIRNFGSTGEHPTILFGGVVRNSCSTQEVDREIHVKNAILIDFPFLPPNIRKAWSSPMGIDMEKEIFAYHQREKDKLLTEFERLTSRVSFSIKIMKKEGWISITAHFINADFNLVKKLIGFKKLPDVSSNLPDETVGIIESCISNWKLENKIFSFTTETKTNGFEWYLKKKFESKMILEFLDITSACFKDMVGYCYYSGTLRKYDWNGNRMNKIIKFVLGVMRCYYKEWKLNEIAKEKGHTLTNEERSKGLPIGWDPRTDCWKICCAVVKMFKDALLCKEVFEQRALVLKKQKQRVPVKFGGEPSPFDQLDALERLNFAKGPFSELDPSDHDWPEMAEEVDRFEAIKSIIDLLSNFKRPTSNLYFQGEQKVRDKLKQLDGEWYPCILYVACVLDPRYKLTFLKYYLKEQCDTGDEEVDRIRIFLQKLLHVYVEKQAKPVYQIKAGYVRSRTIDWYPLYIKRQKISGKLEMQRYLGEEPVDTEETNFDVLGWWRENESRYPILSKMARDVLAHPACVYSIEENLNLDLVVLQGTSPELVEATICSKDWILSDVPRPQELVQRRNDKSVNADNAHHDSAVEIPCSTSPIFPSPNKTLEAVISISENSQGTQQPQPTLQKQLSENAPDEDEEKTKAALHQVRENNRGKFFNWGNDNISFYGLGLNLEEFLAVEVLKEIEPTVVIVKIDTDPDNPIRLTRKQMDSLLCYSHKDDGERWIIDQVIDAYINIINHRRDPSNKVLIVSALDTRLLRIGIRTMCKTTSKIRELGTKFLNNELIFFPINMGGVHWIVAALNIIKHEFQILDSNVMSYNSVSQSTYDFLACELCPGIQACIESVCDSNEAMQARANQFYKAMRNINIIKTVPQQTDKSSCGLFALRYIQFWNGSDIPNMLVSSQWEMDMFRRKVAAELIMSELNLMKVIQQEIKELSKVVVL